MILWPLQCRMARAALGWGVRDLAAAAKVSVDTVARFERGAELKERTVDSLQRAFEAAGVQLGFYFAGWGPLPFAFGPVPAERYFLLQLAPSGHR